MELPGAVRPAYLMSGEETLATLDALHAEIASLQTYRLEVMARLDETGYTKELSGCDTARFLATRHRLNKPEVQRDLKLAVALPRYPLVAAALPDPHAPAGPDPTIQYADTDTDATGSSADPEGTDQGSLTVELPVLLHPAQAEAIVSTFEAIPAAAMVPVENLAAAEEQLVEAGRHFSPWELKKLTRRVRDILDTDGPEPAEEQARRRESLRLTNADHGVKFSGFLAAENAELFKTAIEAGAKPRPTLDGQPDPRTRDQRQAGALNEVIALATATEELPAHGGVKPHITVTMDLADLLTGGRDATGDLTFGDGLSASAVRRLACDAGIIPIVLGAESEPLDVGREQRYVTKAMRRALNARDQGCVVCGMPPRYCHAHHIVSWLDGGATSLSNLVLACGRDHLAVHAGHYTVAVVNGHAQVTRPSWADPPRTTPHHRPAWATTGHTTGAAATRSTGASPTTRAATGPGTGASPTTRAATGPGTGASPTTRAATGPGTGASPTTRAATGPGTGASPTTRAATGPDPCASPTPQGTSDASPTTGSGCSASARASGTPEDGSHGSANTTGERTGLLDLTGTDNDPYWGQPPPDRALRPVRAFPMVGDPPPLAATRPIDFDPWEGETLDTG